MKKLFVLTAALLAVAAACDKKGPETLTPVINVAAEYQADYSASSHSVPYSIDNPVEDAGLQAVTDCEWITDLSADGSEITFDLAANMSSDRKGEILLSYPGAEDVVLTVSQGSRSFTDLSALGTSNCYIVTEAGAYKFKVVKGNGTESVGTPASAQVLWESFGTDTAPKVGELIASAGYSDGYVSFMTAETYREGNAVIAVKDSQDNILWSWHIWMTDRPEDCVYNNSACVMMDRNLGATSAAKGDVGSLGLMYQWGRKDPFLGSSSISSDTKAKSTITWPAVVSANETFGTVEYTIAHPTTFVTHVESTFDWFFSGSSNTDNTRWQSEKTIYDPCPPGYKTPDGQTWADAFGQPYPKATFDSTNSGFDFGSSSGNPSLTSMPECWYPATGLLSSMDGSLTEVGYSGYYRSCAPSNYYANSLTLWNNGSIIASLGTYRAHGESVRCVKE